MICRRCGFEEIRDGSCPLCGWVVDLAPRRDQRTTDGYPLLVRCPRLAKPLAGSLDELALGAADAGSRSNPSRCYLFDLSDPDPFFRALELLRSVGDWQIVLDGRPRPYARELWLPYLALFQGHGD